MASPNVLDAARAARAELDAVIQSLESGETSPKNSEQAIGRSNDFIRAMMGPDEFAIDLILSQWYHATLCAAMELGVFQHLPQDGSAIDEDVLAKKVGVGPEILSRILKMVATEDMIREPEEGKWAMTPYTMPLVRPALHALGSYMFGDFGHIAPHFGRSLKKNPDPTPTDCAFTMAEGKPLWEYLVEHPDMGTAFGLSMESISKVDDCVPILKDWIKAKGITSGKFIDLGGGNGHVDIRLAKEVPYLKYEIQDLNESQFDAVQADFTDDQRAMISYRKHNFFEEQPEHDDKIVAILTRRVLHDWRDEDVIRILRQIVPVMEKDPNVPLLINDFVMPPAGEYERHVERRGRRMDMGVLIWCGAKERSAPMWKRLMKEVDPRLEITQIIKDEHAPPMGVVEVRLKI